LLAPPQSTPQTRRPSPRPITGDRTLGWCSVFAREVWSLGGETQHSLVVVDDLGSVGDDSVKVFPSTDAPAAQRVSRAGCDRDDRSDQAVWCKELLGADGAEAREPTPRCCTVHQFVNHRCVYQAGVQGERGDPGIGGLAGDLLGEAQ